MTTMMMKVFAIRLWAPAILFAGMALAASVACLEAQTTAAQASQSATKPLLDKARAQEARGRRDLAVQTWQQVLLTEPRNPEALANLARAYRLGGDARLADSYQQRLRAVNPNDPSLAGTQRAGMAPDQQTRLQQAAKLSDAGKYAAAMVIYRQAFGTHPPPGDWAVAFYETEAETEGGRPPAVEGLRALVEKYPSDARYQISLGRVLTFSPATREQGRKYLESFPHDPRAVLALRQSLLWDAANPAVAPRIRAYLANHQDAQLAAIFQMTQPASKPVPAPITTPEASTDRTHVADEVVAYQALNSNRIEEAETSFKAILASNPGDSKALAGIGYVRMQQGNFLGAISFLEQAARGNPDDKELLTALDTARFRFMMSEARNAVIASDLTMAEKRYRAALELQPNNSEALEGLGGTLLRAQQPVPAISLFERAVQAQPASVDGWRGLFMAQFQGGDPALALATAKRIPPAVLAQLMHDPLFLQPLASAYAAVGRGAEALATLQSALNQQFPTDGNGLKTDIEIQNAWLLYNGMDDTGLYRQLISLGTRHDLTAEQRQTVQTIWTNWAARRANQATTAGNPRRALAILNAAARAFPDNPAAIKSLAIGYAQAGQPHQAVLIYKAQNMASANVADYEAAVTSALADGDNKDAEIWLRYALKAYPADPRILILAARYEQARGDTRRAIQYYRASLKAMPPVAPASNLAADLGPPAPLAPLSLPSADQSEDISILLAPGFSDSTPVGEEASQTHASPSPGAPSATSLHSQAEVDLTLQSAASLALSQPSSPPAIRQQQAASSSPSGPLPAPRVEVNSPSVVSVTQPPAQPVPDSGKRNENPSAVSVQLGDNTPHPMQSQVDVTDVLPTARYAPSARANQAAASHEEVAAARAARIRRLQEDSNAARTGQSHPPPEDTVTVATQTAEPITPAHNGSQVAQPSSPPLPLFDNIPDTGAQQYPQPSTPPPPSGQTAIANSPSIPRTRPRVPETAPPAAAPEQVVAQPAPAVSQPAPIPSTPPIATNPGSPSAGSFPSSPPNFPAHPIVPPPTDTELRARNLPPLDGYFPAQAPIPMTQRQQAESELASLEGSYSGWLGGTGIGRYRDGAAGIDRLYDVEAPAETSAVIARSMRLTVVALPVFLNSGSLDTSAFATGNVPYLGTLAANAINPPARQYSNGIGGEIQLTTRNIGLAAGYTPYKFLVRNFLGRLQWNTLRGHLSLYSERQPVKDTQLSYAGLHDPGASFPALQGPIWGGVISNIGGLRLNFGSQSPAFYVSGEGGILTGQHVLDNTKFGGTTGVNFRVGDWPDHGSLMLGGTLSGMHYAYNESGLSYGQGGYFSPSSFFLASMPVSFNGHYKANFHYVIAGSLGVQTFEQGQAPFFPLDPSLQSNFVPSNRASCSASQSPSYNCGEYPLTDTTAFTYSFNSQASYRFADHWYAGGFVFANNARNYNTVSAGFFLRYVFRAQHSQEGYPAGLFSIDGFRPLQIP